MYAAIAGDAINEPNRVFLCLYYILRSQSLMIRSLHKTCASSMVRKQVFFKSAYMNQQTVLILGGGYGRRFGVPKLFAHHAGTGFLERILARCAESFTPIILAAQPQHATRLMQRLKAWRAQRPLSPLLHTVWVAGKTPMLSSVQTGLKHLQRWPTRIAGCWLWPVDAPFISATGWGRARCAVQSQPQCVWKLRKHPSAGKGGHPLWLPRGTWPLIRQQPWKGGVKEALLHMKPTDIKQLILEGERLHDVDYRHDLLRG